MYKTPIRYKDDRFEPDPGRCIDVNSERAKAILASLEEDLARKPSSPSRSAPMKHRAIGAGISVRRRLSMAEKVEVAWLAEIEDRIDIAKSYKVSPTTVTRILKQSRLSTWGRDGS